MYNYFQKGGNDVAFYERHIAGRLPAVICDAHVHMNLPAHVKNITPETIAGDWALECGLLMSYEDAQYYAGVLFEGKRVEFVALPWPLRDADTAGNNAYISKLTVEHGVRGLMTIRPEYSVEYIEQAFAEGRFCGFKPYPYMASSVKGADVSIFDFMPHAHFALADKLKASVLMHLPRPGRLPDPDNIAEIRQILETYPHVKLVLAHYGRCFGHEHFEQALRALGDDASRLYFDTAAVLNPKVHALAFEHLDYRRILYGTDLPIFLWHGKCEWIGGNYYNLSREDFSWNKHKYPHEEAGYTFFLYEQLKIMLDVIGDDERVRKAVFYDNARTIYR